MHGDILNNVFDVSDILNSLHNRPWVDILTIGIRPVVCFYISEQVLLHNNLELWNVFSKFMPRALITEPHAEVLNEIVLRFRLRLVEWGVAIETNMGARRVDSGEIATERDHLGRFLF